MRKPIGHAFLLNNRTLGRSHQSVRALISATVSHIRNTTSSFTSDIIGPGAEDMLNKAFRDAKS